MSEILIVDDERRIREVLARWLGDAGYTIHEADNANGAVAVLAEKPIAVALLDKDMPGDHDGLWIVEQIQNSRPAVAMLLCTGDAAIPPRVSLSRGIQGYLVKPFKKEVVLQAVKDALAWHADAPKEAPKSGGADPIDAWLQGRAGRPPSDQ